jgi:hypothetical protein
VQALRDAGTRLAGDLLVAAVADEETASIGMADVLRHVRPDAAIVTEPTELALCLAHKGFAWIDVTVHGRAAHGSRFDLGVDANIRMGACWRTRCLGKICARTPHLVGRRRSCRHDRGRFRPPHVCRRLPPADRAAHHSGEHREAVAGEIRRFCGGKRLAMRPSGGIDVLLVRSVQVPQAPRSSGP